ncbi:Amastin surface glycoprotein, putative [Angomonas deanei]|uniref:Amastin surface glycoprotein, putative n=1 Tax=Angomonas deanei TaxID=59799 RepID=A0A7G2CUF0_9TRYP|nr:Amastin surface glycoprotein, putative [Angomonas deanei]
MNDPYKEDEKPVSGTVAPDSKSLPTSDTSDSQVSNYFLHKYRTNVTYRRHGTIKAVAFVCFLIQLLVLVFIVVATPLDAFKGRQLLTVTYKDGSTEENANLCLSIWGKHRCGERKVLSNVSYKGFQCHIVEQFMTASFASAIIAIFFCLVTLITLIIFLFANIAVHTSNEEEDQLVAKDGPCLSGTALPGVGAMLSMGFLLYTMAFLLGSRNKGCGNRYPQKIIATDYAYGPAMPLAVTAFVLEFIEMILLFAVMCL